MTAPPRLPILEVLPVCDESMVLAFVQFRLDNDSGVTEHCGPFEEAALV